MSAPPRWPAELDLLAACCRWPPSPEREAAVRERAAAVGDWDRFGKVVARHRVAALAADGLRRAGVRVPTSVAAQASAEARRALDMAGETLRLSRAFEQAGMVALFLKGTTLAQIAYGELGMKQSWDIDILVANEEALEGCRMLQRHGYRLVAPAVGERKLHRHMRFAKEWVLFNPERGISVELHWRLTDNRRLLAGVDAGSPQQRVPIGRGSVPTFADAPMFAYLCVHGAGHGWSRLKWLADLEAFLAGRAAADIERLCREAERLGAGNAPAAALLLCHRLFGLPLESALLRELEGKPGAQEFAATAVRCMAYGRGYRELKPLSWPALLLARRKFGIVPGRRYAWSELVARWTGAPERAEVDLPESLDFLYHLLRLPLILGRHGLAFFPRSRT